MYTIDIKYVFSPLFRVRAVFSFALRFFYTDHEWVWIALNRWLSSVWSSSLVTYRVSVNADKYSSRDIFGVCTFTSNAITRSNMCESKRNAKWSMLITPSFRSLHCDNRQTWNSTHYKYRNIPPTPIVIDVMEFLGDFSFSFHETVTDRFIQSNLSIFFVAKDEGANANQHFHSIKWCWICNFNRYSALSSHMIPYSR